MGQEAVAFSPDGTLVATGGGGETWLWEVSTGLALRSFSGDRGVAFSPDGKSIFTSTLNGGASLWEVRTGRQLVQFGLPLASEVVMSPDGKILATGTATSILLWNASNGKQLAQFASGDHKGLTSVAISHNGHLLVSGFNDGTVQLWDLEQGRRRIELSVRDGDSRDSVTTKYPSGNSVTAYLYSVNQLTFSVDDRWLVGAVADGSAKAWDLMEGKYLGVIVSGDSSMRAVALAPDGASLLTGTDDGGVYLWDAKIRQKRTLRDPAKGESVSSVTFSADGNYALASSHDNAAQMWNLADGTERQRFRGTTSAMESVAADAGGRRIVTAGRDQTARVWDTATGQEQALRGHTGTIISVAISRDGTLIATGSIDRTVRIWDPLSGNAISTLSGYDGPVVKVAFSTDGKRLLSLTHDSAELWDLPSGKEVLHLEQGPGNDMTGVLSPEGKTLYVAGSDNEKLVVESWNVETKKLGRTFKLMRASSLLNNVNFATISPDGSELVTGTNGNALQVWDLVAGGVVQQLSLKAWPTSASFSIDGSSLLLSEPYLNRALAFDFRRGLIQVNSSTAKGDSADQDAEAATAFADHLGPLPEATYVGDGRLALTASEDGTARLWDAKTGNWLVAMAGLDGGGWLVVDPQGRFDTSDLDATMPFHWVADDDSLHALPLEIFMRDYYTPGLLSRVMKGEKLPAVRSIAEIANRVQPDVWIGNVTPSDGIPGRVDVIVHAASHIDDNKQASGLQDLRLFRDGQMVANGYMQGPLKDGDYIFHDVALKADARKVAFSAYAFNSERIKSATATFEYETKNPIDKVVKPKAYLLQIGVNHYAASRCELNYSVADSEKMSEELAGRLKAQGYDVEAVKLESDAGGDVKAAGREAIRAQLAAIAQKATPDDVFFVSFSGHGYSAEGGEFYILPSDIQGSCRDVNDAMLKSAISADELADWLRPIDAGEMTLILDACFSAESVQAGGFKPGPLGSRGLGQFAYDKRMRVLAASQSDEVAHEYDSLHQGLLTYVLTHNGLDEGKADWKPVDKKITVGEWLAYAANAVPKFTLPDKSTDSTSKAAGSRFGSNAANGAIQIPALFDFSKTDRLQLK